MEGEGERDGRSVRVMKEGGGRRIRRGKGEERGGKREGKVKRAEMLEGEMGKEKGGQWGKKNKDGEGRRERWKGKDGRGRREK